MFCSHRSRTALRISAVLTVLVTMLSIGPAQEPEIVEPESKGAAENPLPTAPISVDEARRQAEILHTAMHAALQTVHHRYYREDAGLPIPAAVLDEIFAEVQTDRGIQLRWLAVEGQAMNTDHKARTPFEQEAVKALKSGQLAHEQVDQGVYRRAGAITLTNHCLKCHVPDRKSTQNRTAGLIVAIPMRTP